MTTEPFVRLVSPGTTDAGRLFVTIDWNGTRLSITGVEGPKANGDCCGSCGQCRDALGSIGPRAWSDGWTPERADQLGDVWDRWHLNDLRAGTPAQEAWIREHRHEFPGYPTSFYTWACDGLAAAGLDPDGDYRYGSAWLHEDVPADVLRWLHDLPETDRAYPWVKREVAR